MNITSKEFVDGDRIPDRFAQEHENVSPPLEWADLPAGTKELALICEDPDAPMKTWVHWVIYGIPVTVDHMADGVSRRPVVAEVGQAKQGKNDSGSVGYDGPRPPRGPEHRYYFRLFALKDALNLEPGATASLLRKAMQGKTLEETELMGTYSR